MIFVKNKSSKNYLKKELVKELAPSSRQLLNGQEVQRISKLHKFEIRFEVGILEAFVEEVRKCVNSKKERSGYVLSTENKMERVRSSICRLQR